MMLSLEAMRTVLTTRPAVRGFNLIEIAIVLAVVGLIIGGIYLAASSVSQNNRQRQLQTQLLFMVQAVRNVYATSAGSGSDLTTAQANQAGIFPPDMASGNHAFNASAVVNVGSGGTFTITLNSLSSEPCVDILTKAFGSNIAVQRLGLTAVTANGSAINNVATSGVSVTSAISACGAAGGNVVFTFNTRG